MSGSKQEEFPFTKKPEIKSAAAEGFERSLEELRKEDPNLAAALKRAYEAKLRRDGKRVEEPTKPEEQTELTEIPAPRKDILPSEKETGPKAIEISSINGPEDLPEGKEIPLVPPRTKKFPGVLNSITASALRRGDSLKIFLTVRFFSPKSRGPAEAEVCYSWNAQNGSQLESKNIFIDDINIYDFAKETGSDLARRVAKRLGFKRVKYDYESLRKLGPEDLARDPQIIRYENRPDRISVSLYFKNGQEVNYVFEYQGRENNYVRIKKIAGPYLSHELYTEAHDMAYEYFENLNPDS